GLGQHPDAVGAEQLRVLVQGLDRGRAHNHWDRAGARIEGQKIEDGPAMFFATDPDVLNDQIGLLRLHELVHAIPLAADEDFVVLIAFEQIPHQFEKRRVVVDYRNARATRSPGHGRASYPWDPR